MKKLTDDEELEIRNRLDYIGERLYLERKEESASHHWQDLHWAYNTIKSLLYKIHEMERGK